MSHFGSPNARPHSQWAVTEFTPSLCVEQAYHTFFTAIFLLALTVMAYKASLKANKNAAVMTLWVTFGPMPITH